MRTEMYNLCTHFLFFSAVRTAEEVYMRFAIGDLIVYGETGVCRVEDIAPRVFLDTEQLCYKLSPIYQNCTIFTPVEGGNVFMRPILESGSAEALINGVPSIQPSEFSAVSPRELSAKYDAIIKSHDCNEWLSLVVTIRSKRDYALANKKKLSAIDERFGKKAEDLLYGELAASLGSTKADIAVRISDELSK